MPPLVPLLAVDDAQASSDLCCAQLLFHLRISVLFSLADNGTLGRETTSYTSVTEVRLLGPAGLAHSCLPAYLPACLPATA